MLKRLLSLFLLTLFGLFVGFVLIETGIRLSSHSKKAFWTTRPSFYFKEESSDSMQDFQYSSKKPSDTFRIAVVGDSYSFAPYMQFTDSFPKILERMLNLNDTSLKAEVINYGVPAYSTSHEEATVKRAIRDEADLIILQITLNDPELKAIRPSGIGNFSDRFGELKPSGIWESIFKYSKAIEFVAKRLHATKTHSEYVKYFNDLFLNPKTLTPWKRSVNNIVNSTKDAGKKMVAVVFPLFGVPLNDSYPFFEIQHMACDTLSRQEIPCLELFEPFRNIPIDIIQVLPGEDRHPNEIGHRIAAEAIYVWLEKLEIIPNELMIRQKFKQRIGRIPEQQLPMK